MFSPEPSTSSDVPQPGPPHTPEPSTSGDVPQPGPEPMTPSGDVPGSSEHDPEPSTTPNVPLRSEPPTSTVSTRSSEYTP